MKRLLPLHEMAVNFGLVSNRYERKRGPKPFFSAEGKVALMFLKIHTGLSAPKLMEQISQNAERDSIKYKMVEFMEDKIGNTYDAHISGITSYGIYAQIDENHCEGMIPIRDLGDDYYDFDEKNYMIVGRRHHTKYQLGDPIRIQVARANLERKQLDFTLADD